MSGPVIESHRETQPVSEEMVRSSVMADWDWDLSIRCSAVLTEILFISYISSTGLIPIKKMYTVLAG